MTFTTVTFLIFLVVVFTLYWALKHRTAQNVLLMISSYVFYGWWDVRFCGLMILASLLDYWVGLALEKYQDERWRKFWLAVGLTGNLTMLGFFKYYNFFAENFKVMAESVGWQVDFVTLKIVLPVGISFYTFQTMSYSIDIYRRKLKATSKLVEYLTFVSFFPQLVAGPIERATNLLPQFFKARVFNHEQAVAGCRQMLWGFFKKMAIADNLAPFVDQVYANPGAFRGPELALATVFFAFQIYCDFSAYSDIAIGLGRLFGFELMRNFAYPYFSQSMGEFWRRWHISLSTWFKDYVYIPMGGSQCSPVRRGFNVMVTFLLSGLWHGASWNFIAWGGINGLAVLPETVSSQRKTISAGALPGGERKLPTMPMLGRILLTFTIVCIGWVFFRARTFSDALLVLKKVFTELFLPASYFGLGLAEKLNPIGPRVFLLLLLLVGLEWHQRRHPNVLTFQKFSRPVRWTVYTVMIWGILYLGTYSQSSFIYFQF